MATYTIDWQEYLDAATAMDAELPLGAEISPAHREFYTEAEGKLVLDGKRRDALVAELTRANDHDKLQNENERLKKQHEQAAVRDEVRRCLTMANFRPEFMNAAAAQFMAEHRFAVRDGKVIVVGKAGINDALAAAVQWADSGEVDALLGRAGDEEGGGEFMQAVNRMKSVH